MLVLLQGNISHFLGIPAGTCGAAAAASAVAAAVGPAEYWYNCRCRKLWDGKTPLFLMDFMTKRRHDQAEASRTCPGRVLEAH